MAVACGESFTAVVSELGEVFAWGMGDSGQLGLGTNEHEVLPSRVGGQEEVFGSPIVVMAAGDAHSAGVGADGALWTWGKGEYGQLGHDDREKRNRPTRLGKEMIGGSPAVHVACGRHHVVVLTAASCVWTCGRGKGGILGHDDEEDRLVLTLVGETFFRGEQIVFVAAGSQHSVAVGTKGAVWTWGRGSAGRLGHNNEQDRLVPTQLAAAAFGGARVVMVGAGGIHNVAVTRYGALWAWGYGDRGQLGLDDRDNRLAPTLVAWGAGGNASFCATCGFQLSRQANFCSNCGGAVPKATYFEEDQAESEPEQLARYMQGSKEALIKAYGGPPPYALMAACSDYHTLVVTREGAAWSCGEGANSKLGHNDDLDDKLTFTRIEAQHFDHAKIVAAAAGTEHSAALTEHGALYTWGNCRNPSRWHEESDEESDEESESLFPNGLGHADLEDKLVPTRVIPHLLHGARVGRCHGLPPLHVLAFAMGTHPRLGRVVETAPAADGSAACAYFTMPSDLVQRVVAACGPWPEGRTGELEGVVRLLGGGVMGATV